MKTSKVSLTSLLFTFIKISLMTIGGGLVMIPIMEEEFVKKRKCLTEKEFLDIILTVQALPGVVAINGALLIGHRLRGWVGALVAMIGVITPSIVVIYFLAGFLNRIIGFRSVQESFIIIRGGVLAVVSIILFRMAQATFKHYFQVVIASLVFIGIYFFKFDAVLLMVMAGLAGWFFSRAKKNA